MPENQSAVKVYVCPSCFAREVDVIQLRWDEKDQEYYCFRCAWGGSEEKVKAFFAAFTEARYPGIRMHHPFARMAATEQRNGT